MFDVWNFEIEIVKKKSDNEISKSADRTFKKIIEFFCIVSFSEKSAHLERGKLLGN